MRTRRFAVINTNIWHSPEGFILKTLGGEERGLAFYLLTSLSSNMIGMYHLSLSTMVRESGVGSPLQGAYEGTQKGLPFGQIRTIEEDFAAGLSPLVVPPGALIHLKNLFSTDWAEYHLDSETVWIPSMAAMQAGGGPLSETDKRAIGVQKIYREMVANPFLPQFFDQYGSWFHLPNRRNWSGDTRYLSDYLSRYKSAKEQHPLELQAPSKVTEASISISKGMAEEPGASSQLYRLDLRPPSPPGTKKTSKSLTRQTEEIRSVLGHFRRRLTELRARQGRRRPKTREYTSDSAEWRLVKTRLSAGLSPELMCQSIDGMFVTPHNLGQNDRGQEYLSISIALRESNVQRFLSNAENPPQPEALTRQGKELQAALRAPLNMFENIRGPKNDK